MSVLASVVRVGFKLSGVKKMFGKPEKELLQMVDKMNRNREFYLPSDHKFVYEKRVILDEFPCLVMQKERTPAKHAILFFFGGGMMIGPDKGDVAVLQKLCAATGCDGWFPFYPLCTEHCITRTYEMSYECYRQMVGIYGGGNVSTCGFSSGGMLALGIAAHNSALGRPLAQPRHIAAISPGECPWNEAEHARMKALNDSDVGNDYTFMASVEKFMRHGEENVPEYMLAGSRGDFTGTGDIHFFYSKDEILYGALPEYEEACRRSSVPYTVTARPGMVHCYCIAPYFREAREDFGKLAEFLKQ